MKKLLIMIVMLFAVVSLTACGENLDALELLERSHETEAHIAGIANLQADITMSMEGMTFDMPMTVRLEIESEERMRMDMTMTIPMEGEIIETIFVRDGYIYTDENGTLTRSEVVDADVMEMAEAFNSDLESLTADMIIDSSAERTDDGYRLEFTLNQEGLLLIFDDLDMGDDMFDISAMDEDEFEESNNLMIIYMDEDYRLISSETTLQLDMSVEEMGIAMDISMDMIITIEAADVTINFPDWLDEVGNVVPMSEADLIGTWEWDLGDYIYVFNADGTGLVGFPESLEAFTWQILNGNHLYLDFDDWVRDRRVITLVDNVLTLTGLDDSFEFSYIRTTDFELPSIADEDNNGDADNNGDEDQTSTANGVITEEDLAHVWAWDGDAQILYAFNLLGVGMRSGTGVGGFEIFDWQIVDGNLHLDFESVAMFGVDYEMWSMTIEGDVLTLESLQGGGTYRHIRQ